MKKTFKYLGITLLTIGFALTSCTKEGPSGPEGPQGMVGEQGIQGPTGENGNANVQAFDLVINKTDWGTNLHYGGGNVYRAYTILPENVGGIDIPLLSAEGGAVLLYAFIDYEDAAYQTEDELKQLPFLTTVNNMGLRFGLKMEFSISRSSLLLAETEHGWDARNMADENVPDEVDVRIVLIESAASVAGKQEASPLEALKKAGINLDDYTAVMDYFGLDY